MSLPVAGGMRQPSRPATHTPQPFDKVIRLAGYLDDGLQDAGTDTLTMDVLEDIAAERGIDPAELLAAAIATQVQFDTSEPITFAVCAARCQGWGAVDCLRKLIALRQDRQDEGQALFNIQARSCMDRCEEAPVVLVDTPDGAGIIPAANSQSIADAVAQVCG